MSRKQIIESMVENVVADSIASNQQIAEGFKKAFRPDDTNEQKSSFAMMQAPRANASLMLASLQNDGVDWQEIAEVLPYGLRLYTLAWDRQVEPFNCHPAGKEEDLSIIQKLAFYALNALIEGEIVYGETESFEIEEPEEIEREISSVSRDELYDITRFKEIISDIDLDLEN